MKLSFPSFPRVTRHSRLFIFFFLAAIGSGEVVRAAPQTFALKIADGKLDGPGAEIIRGELRTAQFILYGEDHGFADSPSSFAPLRMRHARSVSPTMSSRSARFRHA